MAIKKKSVTPKKTAPKKSNKKTVKPVKKKVAESSRLKDAINSKPLGKSIGCGDLLRDKATPPTTHNPQSTSLSWPDLGRIMPLTSPARESEKQSPISKYISDLMKSGKDRVIQITVRNVSNHTLRDVKLFDNDFMNQQDIHYSTGIKEVPYIDLLRRKNSLDKPDTKIKVIHIVSLNSNQPFQTLRLTDSDIDGTSFSVPHWPVLDPYQMQSGIAIVKREFGFYIGSNIIVDTLHADTKVTYSLYLTNP